MYITYAQVTDLADKRDYAHMMSLANIIKTEVVLASQVKNNYIRRFELPPRLNSKLYKIELNPKNSMYKDELEIQLLDENNEVMKRYNSILPVKIKGSFMEEVKGEMLDYCITQNSHDGIRIARNQASIEFYKVNEGEDLDIEDGKLKVSNEDIVELLVRLNCVENIQAIQFTLAFPEDKLTFIEYCVEDDMAKISAVQRNPETSDSCRQELNAAFFEEIFEGGIFGYDLQQYRQNPPKRLHSFWDPGSNDDPTEDTAGTITGGFIAEDFETGSGDIAILKFEVKPDADEGEATVEFDPEFNPLLYPGSDENLVILDISTGKETTGGLPDSKVGATLIIQ
ncbi:hypothetical protein JW930_00990 [Candidatus Woesearchaeota archaeon]|nr:hypothetical protein [Candidatus Woesearchaeota archaeon]